MLLALLAPVLPLTNPTGMDIAHRLAPPSWGHWLGQDEFGRDVLSRLIWGARVSLTVAFSSSALACIVGTALGLVGGYLGRVAELLTLRSMDIILCFPPLLLALLIVTLLGPGAGTLIPVLALLYLPGFVRVTYAGVLSVRSQQYVEAMRVLGARPGRIMFRTILPNIGGPLLVQFSLAVASADPAGIRAVVPGSGRGAAGAVLGADDRLGPIHHGAGAAAAAVAVPCAEPDHSGDERTVRCAARCG